MAAKEVKFSVEARDKMLRGIDILARLARDSANKRLIEHRQLLLGTFEIHRHNAMIVECKGLRTT